MSLVVGVAMPGVCVLATDSRISLFADDQHVGHEDGVEKLQRMPWGYMAAAGDERVGNAIRDRLKRPTVSEEAIRKAIQGSHSIARASRLPQTRMAAATDGRIFDLSSNGTCTPIDTGFVVLPPTGATLSEEAVTAQLVGALRSAKKLSDVLDAIAAVFEQYYEHCGRSGYVSPDVSFGIIAGGRRWVHKTKLAVA